MTRGEEVFKSLQVKARSTASRTGGPAPTQEYLVRHLLESFLGRLSGTEHGQDFVLKGGILLAAYGVRRPTKDVDANAISADVTPEHLRKIVAQLAAVPTDDGVTFDVGSVGVQEIRESVDYPGFRVRVKAAIGPWRSTAAWDVSTGDPIVPAPRRVTIERVLGEPLQFLGYAAETTIAEKAVPILERGITSTRWRDYVDIVQLCRQGFDPSELRRSAEAVARYRGVTLEPVGPHLEGYGSIGQAKWAAWRRKEHLEDLCEVQLDDQVALVAEFVDPIFRSEPQHDLARPRGLFRKTGE